MIPFKLSNCEILEIHLSIKAGLTMLTFLSFRLKFDHGGQTGTDCFISSDMFYFEVCVSIKSYILLPFFYIPIKIYNTDLLVTLLTEYLTTLQGRCHWVQNTMTTPWHHKKLRRFTYELQKKKKIQDMKKKQRTLHSVSN